MYSVSQTPPGFSDNFFSNGWGLLVQITRLINHSNLRWTTYFLYNYLQFWRSYPILSATTQFTPHFQNVHHRPKHVLLLAFSDIFPKQLGIFGPNFTHLLVPTLDYKCFIQLSPTVTKLGLGNIKYDHPACVSTDGGRFEHIMVVVLNMA